MQSSIPLRLSAEDKLDVLSNLDEFRFWHSLDDQRCCARCHQTITGRQVLVFERVGTRGKMRLQCPTAGCVSTPSEWMYADPVLAASQRSTIGTNPQRFRIQQPEGTIKHHGPQARTVRRKIRDNKKHRRWAINGAAAFWGAAAQLPILRSLATRLHAFQPVP